MKQLQRAKISALGTYVPPRLLTNADLEKMVETNDQWIQERTGIRQRHLVDKGVGTSDISCEAARKALARAGFPASELEAIIVGTVTPDMLFPSTACLVQHKLGAKGAWGFGRIRARRVSEGTRRLRAENLPAKLRAGHVVFTPLTEPINVW